MAEESMLQPLLFAKYAALCKKKGLDGRLRLDSQ
jgi:hypothetical protein